MKTLRNFVLIVMFIASGCKDSKGDRAELNVFDKYYSAVTGGSEDRWNYTTDTVKLWFDDKKGEPVLQIRGKQPAGRWKEWDMEMNAVSGYDSLWFDKKDHSIKGHFYENNDFFRLLGKSPTKTLRTYWFNEDDKINEILIYWIPEENTTTSEKLKPVVEWAVKNDSTTLNQLYPDHTIIPSRENAKRWKLLLERYHQDKSHR